MTTSRKSAVEPSQPPAGSDRRAKRRQSIIEAAARLFASAGYNDCVMDRVASKLRIAKGTLYLYFPGKRELFFACVDGAMEQLQLAVEIASAPAVDDPLRQVSLAIRAYLKFFDQHPHYVELLIQERAIFRDRKRPTYFEYRDVARVYWREVYAGLIRQGKLRADLPVDTILDTLGNLLYGTMFTNRLIGAPIDIDAQHRAIMDVVMNGLLADAHRQPRR